MSKCDEIQRWDFFFNFKNLFALPKCIKKVFEGLNLPTSPEFSFFPAFLKLNFEEGAGVPW